jgi:hypothetical protein
VGITQGFAVGERTALGKAYWRKAQKMVVFMFHFETALAL